MRMTQPPYIAFATHPLVRERLVEGYALVATHPGDGTPLWANQRGAQILGRDSVSALLREGSAPDSIVYRQFAAIAARLSQPGQSLDFTIHIQKSFRREAVKASASLFFLSGDPFCLFACQTGGTNGSLSSLVEGFSTEEAHLAIVDDNGKVLARSSGFERTALEPGTIHTLVSTMKAGGEASAERLATTKTGIWPLQIGALADDMTLLYASQEEAEDIKSEARPVAPTLEIIEPKPSERSALETIAAIDESLGILREAETTPVTTPPSPVVRKVPGQDTKPRAHALATQGVDLSPTRPVRFVWRTDAEGRISEVSGELAETVGEKHADITGLSFEELETKRGVIGGNAIARLLHQTDTWSGRTVDWPMGDQLVPVDLAALPTFTRERDFAGFRGFGLIRLGEGMPAPPHQPEHHEKTVPILTENERNAFDEIAERLRLMSAGEEPPAVEAEPESSAAGPVIRRKLATEQAPSDTTTDVGIDIASVDTKADAIIIQSGEAVLHANPAFLALSGYGSVTAVVSAGGTDALVERGADDRLFLLTADGGRLPVSLNLRAIAWQGRRALALTVTPEHQLSAPPFPLGTPSPRDAEMAALEAGELKTILETATDGIIVLDDQKHIRSLSTPATALFGLEAESVEGTAFSSLFAEESRSLVEGHLDRLFYGRGGDLMNEGMEVIGREAGGGLIPLFMTLGLLPQSGGACAIVRDITGWKQREDDLRTARRDARRAEEERETFLSALRYELRQPLDAIVSLSETMSHEAFGPLGDERYHTLAREIGNQSRQARGVIGRLLGEQPAEPPTAPPPSPEPAANVRGPINPALQVNDAVAEAVSLVQPRANARRIIIRAALSPQLTETPGDPETLKQIAMELLQEAIQFTPAGGQVVVSTAIAADGETVLRFRDNGIAPGRRHKAGEPQQSNTRLAKARRLAEGLGGRFLVHAVPNEGMLVEVFLPAAEARSLHY